MMTDIVISNHLTYYMIWLCLQPFWTFCDLYHVTLTSDRLKIIIYSAPLNTII